MPTILAEWQNAEAQPQLPTSSRPVRIQHMPCNINTPLTYLITCLAFPDLTSSSPKRVKLVQNALKSFDQFDAHEGPYAGEFVRSSGLSDALSMRTELMEIKAECLFDLLTFCTFRAKFEHALKVRQSFILLYLILKTHPQIRSHQLSLDICKSKVSSAHSYHANACYWPNVLTCSVTTKSP